MKRYSKIFGLIAAAAVIGFSITACSNESESDEPASLEGSWHSSVWQETFTFNIAAGTFEKMKDEGWGERGTFTISGNSFTTTITEEKNESTSYEWGVTDAAGKTENRTFIIVQNGKILIINNEHEYTKVDNTVVNPSSLEGSWHSSVWLETFTFNTAAGTFEKMKDEGWGERGTFIISGNTFITTLTEEIKLETGWEWAPTDATGKTETRIFAINGNILLLNNEHEYTKVP